MTSTNWCERNHSGIKSRLRPIDAGTPTVVDEIKKLSNPVAGETDIEHIAGFCDVIVGSS